jgi:hypothetical protein
MGQSSQDHKNLGKDRQWFFIGQGHKRGDKIKQDGGKYNEGKC